MEAYAKRLNGIAARHGLVLSKAAQDMFTAPIGEAAQFSTFDLDQAVHSTELVLMAMAEQHRGLHNCQSVIRAFAKAGPKIPPFTARA